MHKRLPLLAIFATLLVAACAASDTGGLFKSPLATRPGTVDSGEAARLISEYRQSHGLGPVTVNATLTKIAADHAKRMGALDRVDHVLPGEGSFDRRVLSGGYSFSVAAENIGAGYDTLADALEGWRKSPHHNDNLLNPGVKEIGIAVVNATGSKYGTYWSLVLAAPYAVRNAGPGAGPYLSAAGVTVEIH